MSQLSHVCNLALTPATYPACSDKTQSRPQSELRRERA
jgi:hypothetical protein